MLRAMCAMCAMCAICEVSGVCTARNHALGWVLRECGREPFFSIEQRNAHFLQNVVLSIVKAQCHGLIVSSS
jgi:hypothetical protein